MKCELQYFFRSIREFGHDQSQIIDRWVGCGSAGKMQTHDLSIAKILDDYIKYAIVTRYFIDQDYEKSEENRASILNCCLHINASGIIIQSYNTVCV